MIILHLYRVDSLKSIPRLPWGVCQCPRELGHLQKVDYIKSPPYENDDMRSQCHHQKSLHED